VVPRPLLRLEAVAVAAAILGRDPVNETQSLVSEDWPLEGPREGSDVSALGSFESFCHIWRHVRVDEQLMID
jgi:hypothetical protein